MPMNDTARCPCTCQALAYGCNMRNAVGRRMNCGRKAAANIREVALIPRFGMVLSGDRGISGHDAGSAESPFIHVFIDRATECSRAVPDSDRTHIRKIVLQ